MAEVEATLLEGGIEWLAQTILENLDTDKLEEWIRQVGLSDATEKLKSEMERVDVVVAAARQRAIGNKLSGPLGRLRELLYDADNAVDELDYYRLQHQVQGGNISVRTHVRCTSPLSVGSNAWQQGAPESAHKHAPVQADQVVRPKFTTDISRSSGGPGGKRWSKVWKYFVATEYENGKAVKVKCSFCNTELKCQNGASALHNHLRSKRCTDERKANYQPR